MSGTRRNILLPALAAALALAGAPRGVVAQDFTPIRVGQQVEAALAEGDPSLRERGRFRVYRFQAVPGTRYVLNLESDQFDPYLSVARLVGGITDVVKSDDDGGDGTNARLRWTAEHAGDVLVIAQSYSTEGTGDFRLRLEVAPQPSTGAAQPIQVGGSVRGVLTDTDAVMEEDESFYDTYVLRGRSGQRLVVEMASDSFDTYLHFGRMSGGVFESIKTDDDGMGEGTDSRLRITLDEDGEYVIRANALSEGDQGPYTLVVSEREAPAAATRQPLRVGATVGGSLQDSDAVLEDEEIPYDLYAVTARAGQRMEVTLESETFDAYLDVGQERDGAWQSLRTDDDGGEGTNARVRFTAGEAGTYLIRARSFGESGRGDYSLAVRELPAAAAPRPQPISLGQTVRGALTERDAMLEDEEISYDLYLVRGRRGQRLNVEMSSDSFDTYLDLGRMEGGNWESLRTDDDGAGEGTNSRLRFTLPGDGDYLIRARSFGGSVSGTYTLTVTERAGGEPSPARAIRAGEEVSGSLEDNDLELGDGSFYDIYTYAGRAGEELVVEMTSEAFDTFVSMGRMEGEEFEEVASNDDGDDGTNSRLEVRLTRDGEYVIRANSLGGGRTGDYRIRVTSSRDR